MNDDITITKTKEKCPKCHKKIIKERTHYDFKVYEGKIKIKCNCPYCNDLLEFEVKGCDTIELKNKSKNIKLIKFKNFILKFVWIFIPFLLLIFYSDFKIIVINSDKMEIISDLSFISTSIPMIISIITIALSLGDKEIYGIPSFNFRRLRNGFYFSFLSMIMISLVLIALEEYSKVLSSNTSLVYLNVVSVMYSIMFIKQEVPILTNNDKYLMKIVKKVNNDILSDDVKNGKDSFDDDYKKVLTHLVLNKGISQSFKELSKKYSYEKGILINRLLSVIDLILKDYLDNIDKIKQMNDYDRYSKMKHDVKKINDEFLKMFDDFDLIFSDINLEKNNISNLLKSITINLNALSKEFDFKFEMNTMVKILKILNNEGGGLYE